MAVLLILLVPVLVHVPAWIAGWHDDPGWVTSGLALPHRPPLLPGLAGYLDLNAGWTTEALGGSAAHQWLAGRIPWWDPYSGIGMPLAAEMQSSALFLPYVLLLALPGGVTLLTLALQWTAGLATWRLLRRLDLGPLPCVVGALLFELCASFAWMGPPAGLPVAFLPLFLLGLERARAAALAGRGAGWRVTAVAVAFSLTAGFPETAYLDGLLAFVWAAARLAAMPGRRIAFAWRVALGGLVGLALAAPALWPFADLLAMADLGARDGIRMSGIWMPPEGLVQLLTPYALGPQAGLSGLEPTGRLITLWGRAPGYLGMGLAMGAILGAAMPGRNRGLRLVLAGWTALLLARVTGVPGLQSWFRLVPFQDMIQVFRYSGAAFLLPCCLLAAHALGRRPSAWTLKLAASGLAAAAAVAAVIAWPLAREMVAAPRFMALSLAWGMMSLLIVSLAFARGRTLLIAVALVGDAAVLAMAPLASGQRDVRLDLPALAFLHDHLGLQRFATLGPLQPNFGALYGVASVNYNYLPTPRIWSDHVQRNLRPGADPVLFSGNTPVDVPGQATNAQILAQHRADYADLGVRYVLAPAGTDPFDAEAAGESFAPGAVAVRLGPGTTLSGEIELDRRAASAVSVTVGTYAGEARGTLLLELCNAAGCVHGRAALDQAADNQRLALMLDRPIDRGGRWRWTLRQADGVPAAIWTWADAQGDPDPRITVRYAPRPGQPGIVYRDAIMTIFELPDAAAYFTTADPGCTLSAHSRTELDALCATPATLVRRELLLPGWMATVDGLAVPVGRSGPLFQSVALAAGRHHVSFRYRPPGTARFSMLFGLGLLGMLPWTRIFRTPT